MSTPSYEICDRLRVNMQSVLLGKESVVEYLVIALLGGGHVLLEDVPGVGKTLAAKSLAASIDGVFSRIQFTPDLLPSDITGSSIYRSDTREFEFSRGPVFSNILLADEINRAPPRTQSALLEAMSDTQVSADGASYPLPTPFMVVGTQNPLDYEGTYPLPESQLDRFLFRLSVGYPSRQVERQVLTDHRGGPPVNELSPQCDASEIAAIRQDVLAVRVDDAIADYLLDIVEATRRHRGFRVGVSTRAALSLYRGCQARAVTQHRDYVVPDDVKQLAVAALSHRVTPEGMFDGGDRGEIELQMTDLVDQIAVPM